MNDTRTTFCELAWRCLEDLADDADHAALDQMMRDEPGLAEAYADLSINRRTLMEVIGNKGSVAALLGEPDTGVPAVATVEPARTRTGGAQRHWALAACLVVGGLIVALVAWIGRPTDAPIEPENVGPPVAVLVGSDAVRWDREPINEGDEVAAGSLAIGAGQIRLQLNSGVGVSLQGPAELDLSDTMHARLRAGRVLARVPEGAVGFTIETAELRIVDLGTEFGVSVNDDGSTSVHVFDGFARVERDDASRELGAGESIVLVGGKLVTGTADYALFPGARAPGGRLLDLAFDGADGAGVRPIDADNAPGYQGGRMILQRGAGAFIDLDTRDSSAIAEAQLVDDAGVIGRNGSHVYLAWRMQGPFGGSAWSGLSLFRGGDADLRDEPLFVGKAFGQAAASYYTAATGEVQIDGRPTTPAPDPVAPDGRGLLIVMRISYSAGDDQVSIWLDPDLTTDDPPVNPNATILVPDARFDRLRIAVGPEADAWAFDSVRMARNWDDLRERPASGADFEGGQEND